MSMTYNSLVTQTMNTLDKTDSSTLLQVPNFISQAEIKMCELIKTTGVLNYVTGNFISGICVYPYPARWRRTITLNYGTGIDFNDRNFLEPRTYEYAEMYWKNRRTLATTEFPVQFFAEYGPYNFIVSPTPNDVNPYEFGYMGLPEPLTAQNQTNWFTNYASNALFYGTVVEALNYLKDYEQIPAWEAKFKEASSILTITDDYRKDTRQTLREAD